jgi:adenosylcobinamide-GDP ribazoletransferase
MSLRAALSTFTILPTGGPAEFGRSDGARTLLWLPVVGAALGAAAGLPVAAALGFNSAAGLVAAVLGIAALALLTRGLHLDGLADTADGLGSRAPAERALEIMRRSDIGPFGVVSVVFVIGVDVASLAQLAQLSGNQWHACAALATAACTGRLAVVHAAVPGVRSARPAGFGAIVAGSVAVPAALLETAIALGFGAGMAALCNVPAWHWVVAQVVALAVAYCFRWHTTRRFTGVTGDVFGALIEIATAVTLLGIALAG